jgi:hypothetical protein
MIKENVQRILEELPEGVELVAAAKMRTADEVLEVVEAGVKMIGENYVQEALEIVDIVGKRVEWHFLGHLQKNKVKKAVPVFDMIETVDSFDLARRIDGECKRVGKIMPVLIEINSGREPQKSGVMPEDAEELIRQILPLENIRIMGLMTMGPRFGNPEDSRPYFIQTKEIFDRIKGLNLPGAEMRYLSMGMTNSYRIALEEGANMVRIGTKIFGEREEHQGAAGNPN